MSKDGLCIIFRTVMIQLAGRYLKELKLTIKRETGKL